MIKVYALGGVNETGRSMMAYEVDGEIIICDMGLHMANYLMNKDGISKMSEQDKIAKKIIADPKTILAKKDKVKAIAISNGHDDYIGAIGDLAHHFNCPIFGTPMTIELIKAQNKNIKNQLEAIQPGKYAKTMGGTKIEFINTTHSIPQSAMIAIHSKTDGIILHAVAFKFDNRPALGQRTSYERLRELSEQGIKILAIDSIRSKLKRKTLSEILVKEILRDAFIETDIVNTQGMIITTFSSHITRIKSIMELTKELNRKLVILGSFKKYTDAAKKASVFDFEGQGIVVADDEKKINEILEEANKNKTKYVILCSGHQGEKDEVLYKIAHGKTPYKLKDDDKIIFSSEVIPTKVTIESRRELDAKLDEFGCKVFKDLHVSGHATREDLNDLMNMIKPKHIIPVNGDIRLKEGMVELAEEHGYKEGENLHLMDTESSKEF